MEGTNGILCHPVFSTIVEMELCTDISVLAAVDAVGLCTVTDYMKVLCR